MKKRRPVRRKNLVVTVRGSRSSVVGGKDEETRRRRPASVKWLLCATSTISESPTAKKLWPDAATHKDFRHVTDSQDIDVVICGTVDHWHTLISIAAMRAGKDVYCEKPLTLTIDEGKRLVQVAKKTGRILQTGSQQRSDARFRLACELVRNARIGKLKQIDVFLPMGRREGPFKTAHVPRRIRLGHVAGINAESGVCPRTDACHISLLVGILGRNDDRLGRSPQ